MGVPQRLSELAHHVELDLGCQPFRVHREIGVQPQVGMLVLEQDRGAALVFPNLHRLRDPAVGDTLQHLVLALGRRRPAVVAGVSSHR
ncbi:MAG: hypothetical protein ACRDUV_06755 [Pseudonocardiaceae bacterium]